MKVVVRNFYDKDDVDFKYPYRKIEIEIWGEFFEPEFVTFSEDQDGDIFKELAQQYLDGMKIATWHHAGSYNIEYEQANNAEYRSIR